MPQLDAHFIVIEEHNCPLYHVEDKIFLTERVVKFAPPRPGCLILFRELTKVLVELIPSASTNFSEYRDTVFTCRGCTGLLKFQLINDSELNCSRKKISDGAKKQGKAEAIIKGTIDYVLPAELLQFFHMHQKTGRLLLEFEGRSARVAFREGSLLAARYGDLELHEAVYAILAEKKGTFQFFPGLHESLRGAGEMGDFMMILMEGLKRIDEEE